MKVEISPRPEAGIIRQFRYHLVDRDAHAAAFRLREAVMEGFKAIHIYHLADPGSLRVIRVLHRKRNIRRILQQEK